MHHVSAICMNVAVITYFSLLQALTLTSESDDSKGMPIHHGSKREVIIVSRSSGTRHCILPNFVPSFRPFPVPHSHSHALCQ